MINVNGQDVSMRGALLIQCFDSQMFVRDIVENLNQFVPQGRKYTINYSTAVQGNNVHYSALIVVEPTNLVE